ncbi:hypothetical protein FOA52_011167 [Chlamydomonas sp. UWO 241]|nr:hypothetical protein FOA52_011167 [Chlamydomonas sp. UWO 241]
MAHGRGSGDQRTAGANFIVANAPFLEMDPSYTPPEWAKGLAPVRKLEFLMAAAKRGGHDCIITIGGVQSNHARATAVAARYVGFPCHLILRMSRTEVDADPGLTGNLLVDRLVGATIHKAFCAWAAGGTPESRHVPVAASYVAVAAALLVLAVHPTAAGLLLGGVLFLARFFAMAAFTLLYILTPELLPTRVRGSVLGLCNSVSRLGGLVSPFATVWLVQRGHAGGSACVLAAAAGVAAALIALLGACTGGRELQLQRCP